MEFDAVEFPQVGVIRGSRGVIQELACVGNIDNERPDETSTAEDGPCLMALEAGETNMAEVCGVKFARQARETSTQARSWSFERSSQTGSRI